MKMIPKYTFFFSKEETATVEKMYHFITNLTDDVYDALCEETDTDGEEFFTCLDNLYTFVLQNPEDED